MAECSGRTWLITGSSSGFGRVLAEQVLEAGERVAATARNPETVVDLERKYPGRAKAIRLDVTKDAEVKAAVAETLKAFGRIDVLVNNAGYGLIAAMEEATEEEIRRQVETNVFGLVAMTRAVLPEMRKQRSGHIVNLSSIAGLIGGAGLGYYNLTKFAVEGISEALAEEGAPLGIRVTVVEPGPFRTDFSGRSAAYVANEMEEYKASAGKTRQRLKELDGNQKGDPVRAAQAIQRVVDSKHPPMHLVLGEIALQRYREKLEQVGRELADWEEVTLGADFPETEPAKAHA